MRVQQPLERGRTTLELPTAQATHAGADHPEAPGCRCHAGSRRQPPQRIDQRKEHRAPRCPDCGGRLQRCRETRTRYTEDIPQVEPEVTEHVIHRDWCPRCRKKVEPPVADVWPDSTLGNRVLVLSAWLHYGLGNTLSQIAEPFNFHLPMKIMPWQDRHGQRLLKCLRRHQHERFTFLDHPEVPFDNNAVEQTIRPVVIIRNNSYGNRSRRGAHCQVVLMSSLRTLKQRGYAPIRSIVDAPADHLTTGQLPPTA